MHFGIKHRDHEVDARVDVRDLLDIPEVIEHVGVRDREIDALQIEEVAHVSDGAIGDDRQHSQVLTVVEGLAEIGRILGEGALEQSPGETNGPIVYPSRLGGLFLRHRLIRERERPLRCRCCRLGDDQGFRRRLCHRGQHKGHQDGRKADNSHCTHMHSSTSRQDGDPLSLGCQDETLPLFPNYRAQFWPEQHRNANATSFALFELSPECLPALASAIICGLNRHCQTKFRLQITRLFFDNPTSAQFECSWYVAEIVTTPWRGPMVAAAQSATELHRMRPFPHRARECRAVIFPPPEDRAALREEVEAGRIPGAVVAIARGSKLAHLEAVGQGDPSAACIRG